jgi:hypothetical protein
MITWVKMLLNTSIVKYGIRNLWQNQFLPMATINLLCFIQEEKSMFKTQLTTKWLEKAMLKSMM